MPTTGEQSRSAFALFVFHPGAIFFKPQKRIVLCRRFRISDGVFTQRITSIAMEAPSEPVPAESMAEERKRLDEEWARLAEERAKLEAERADMIRERDELGLE